MFSVNSMDAEVKEEVLQTVDFDHFTNKELASDVRESTYSWPCSGTPSWAGVKVAVTGFKSSNWAERNA